LEKQKACIQKQITTEIVRENHSRVHRRTCSICLTVPAGVLPSSGQQKERIYRPLEEDPACLLFFDAITKADYDMFVASKDGEMGELLLNKTKLEAALSTTVDADILVRINEVVDTALNFSDVTREVISRFIEKIEVKANGTVKLFYRFAGSSTVLNELIV
jgi:hypothetical protein